MVYREAKKSKYDAKQTSEFSDLTEPAKEKTLSYLLFIIFPIFPVIYLLAATGILNHNGTVVANMIAGLIAKLGFTAVAMQSHRSVIDKMVEELDRQIQPMIYTIVGGTFSHF